MNTSIWTVNPEVLEDLLQNASLTWPANNDAYEPQGTQDAFNFLVSRDDGTENAARRCYEKIEEALGLRDLADDALSRELRGLIEEKSAELDEARAMAILNIAEVAARRLDFADLKKLENEATASQAVHEVLVAAPVPVGAARFADVKQWGLIVPGVGEISWARITPAARDALAARFAKVNAPAATSSPAQRQHRGPEIT